MARCQECRKLINGTPRTTLTGRTVCQRCSGLQSTTAAGVMQGGLPGAVATRGWFGAVYDTVRGKKGPRKEG
ncbi:hypothetical protein G9U51_06625 [Calidifontibacter sp. DB0510]|uniref:Uncharacterized protein n=1 Tax=Metallococcus carri TaxID=1656884 RepID=A0A967E8P7_9MICO|nr:hypothetical protein [Metallococcus carri]NHN55457.1 hypothetical protein [Metallococcus carri]NOP38359.1 hypothetical protein [Calidifontibacter sp. DB2511S]